MQPFIEDIDMLYIHSAAVTLLYYSSESSIDQILGFSKLILLLIAPSKFKPTSGGGCIEVKS